MSNEQQDSGFDAGQLLEIILATGKQYLEKGREEAEQKLDIPGGGEDRELMLDGLKKGAMASALLLGLLGPRGGRTLTTTAIKLGGLAALGTVAYKGYQNWQQTTEAAISAEQSVHKLEADALEFRGLLLIEAMVAAANADGYVDSQEQQAIKHRALELHLPGEMAMMLENIIDSPLSAGELAQRVTSQVQASEVYVATRLLIGDDSSLTETLYKDSLVTALGLDDHLVRSLEAQIS